MSIKFSLICECSAKFEGWFPSNKDYEKQLADGHLTCPICDSKNVRKDIMSPNIKSKSTKRKKQSKMEMKGTQIVMAGRARTLLKQLESYVKDGRLEMSEVMATQFTDMFLSQKKRDLNSQFFLVKGLRILCDVLLVRGKSSTATASAKILIRERKKLTSIIKQSPEVSPEIIGPISEDFRRCANIFANANKHRLAKKFF